MGVCSVKYQRASLTSGGVTTYVITVPVGMGAMALRNLAATVTIQPPVAIPDILQSNNTAHGSCRLQRHHRRITSGQASGLRAVRLFIP